MPLTPGRILRFFYRTGLPYLPVAEEQNGSLVPEGFLSRRLVDFEMSDMERSVQNYDRIPGHLFVPPGELDQVLEGLKTASRIPVLNAQADQIANWDKSDLYRAVADLRPGDQSFEKPAGEKPAKNPDLPNRSEDQTERQDRQSREGKDDSGGDWLSRLILSTIPDPLFATDLTGSTLFYNEAFTRTILEKPELKRSIRFAEQYFFEWSGRILASVVASSKNRSELFDAHRIYLPELQTSMEIAPLVLDAKSIGTLFVFRSGSSGRLNMELEALLWGGNGLTEILEDAESSIIQKTLEMNSMNISHCASALKMRRSTLQNRIKKLGLEEFVRKGKSKSKVPAPHPSSVKNVDLSEPEISEKTPETRIRQKSTTPKKKIEKKAPSKPARKGPAPGSSGKRDKKEDLKQKKTAKKKSPTAKKKGRSVGKKTQPESKKK